METESRKPNKWVTYPFDGISRIKILSREFFDDDTPEETTVFHLELGSANSDYSYRLMMNVCDLDYQDDETPERILEIGTENLICKYDTAGKTLYITIKTDYWMGEVKGVGLTHLDIHEMSAKSRFYNQSQDFREIGRQTDLFQYPAKIIYPGTVNQQATISYDQGKRKTGGNAGRFKICLADGGSYLIPIRDNHLAANLMEKAGELSKLDGNITRDQALEITDLMIACYTYAIWPD
jgi:hypothetical protein